MSEAKPTKDVVYLDHDDEITSIIDKVESSKSKIVALVLPKRAAALQSIVNMRLLKRSAEKAGKNVVLITSEAGLAPLAGAASLHIAKSLQSKPEIPPAPGAIEDGAPEIDDTDTGEEVENPSKIDYSKPIGELAAAHGVDEESIDLEDADAADDEPKAKPTKTPKDKKMHVPNFEKFRLLVILGVVLLIGLIVFAIFAAKVLPKASITVHTTSTPVTAEFQLKTSNTAKSLDIDKGVIPAQLKSTDQNSSQQVQATGQQNNGDKATGSVTLTLSDCSVDQVTVPAGSGVSTGGLTFITQSSATLQSVKVGNQCKNSSFPNFSSSTVHVTAQQGGAKYNIASGQSFVVSGQSSNVTATNGSAFSGGTDNNITVVSQSDVDKVKSSITTESSDNFTKTFEKQLSDQGFYVLATTLKAGDAVTTANPAVGQPATTVNVTTKITYTVLVVQKSDLQEAINSKVADQVDKSKQKLQNDDPLSGAQVNAQDQSSPTAVTLAIHEDTKAVPIISEVDVKKEVGGLKVGEIQAMLTKIPGVKSVDVNMSPFWVSKAPKSPSKITIKLDASNQ
jgi:hypothetical protein